MSNQTKIQKGDRILVTGSTGYVGGRLVPELLRRGFVVRCIVRDPRKVAERPWRNHARVEVTQGDLEDLDLLTEQLQDCRAAYYLIHSMVSSGGDYAEVDNRLASNFANAAKNAKVSRIIYLGGLGELGSGLSEHLRSRRDLEATLASTGVPLTTLRAAMIIGAGSGSFEILRYLVERLPVMITPRWVRTESQPIAIRDVLFWLAECLETPETTGQQIQIGGPDVVSYKRLMQIMAEELGLPRRVVIGVPVLTPRLSSAWISLITPVTYRLAKPLAEGLRNRVVVTDNSAEKFMPHQPIPIREAISRAVARSHAGDVDTRWSAAGPIPGDPPWAGGKVFVDQRETEIEASPNQVFAAVCRVGGGHGWYWGDILWRIRGWMDQLIGGPGLRRGRRHPEKVEFGEALDFWRVVGIERDQSLVLHAEMILPGTAQLAFELEPLQNGEATRLIMTARFRPRGLLGLAYWYSVVPLHFFVFGGMLAGIKRYAESDEQPKMEHDDLNNSTDARSVKHVDEVAG